MQNVRDGVPRLRDICSRGEVIGSSLLVAIIIQDKI